MIAYMTLSLFLATAYSALLCLIPLALHSP